MHGSLKINSVSVPRKLTAAEALGGFLYVESVPENKNMGTVKGDLILKTSTGYARITGDNPAVKLSWEGGIEKEVIVRYVDITIDYKAVE